MLMVMNELMSGAMMVVLLLVITMIAIDFAYDVVDRIQSWIRR